MAQNSVKPLLLATKASSTVSGTYAVVNGLGFAAAPFFVRIINASSQAVTVSYNGIDDHEYIPSSGVFELPSQTNSQPNAQVAVFPKNTKIYVKGTAGTGSIYVSGYFV